MKTKSKGIRITAAVLWTVTLMYNCICLFNYFSSLTNEGYGLPSIYKLYYIVLIFTDLLAVAANVIFMIALYSGNRKSLAAIGGIFMTVVSLTSYLATCLLSVNQGIYSSYWQIFASGLIASVQMCAWIFMAVSIFILASKPGRAGGLRKCWVLGPALLTLADVCSLLVSFIAARALIRISSTFVAHTLMSFCFSLITLAACYLGMLWHFYANAEMN